VHLVTINVTKDGRFQHASLQIYVDVTLQMDTFLTALAPLPPVRPRLIPHTPPTPPHKYNRLKAQHDLQHDSLQVFRVGRDFMAEELVQQLQARLQVSGRVLSSKLAPVGAL